MKNFKKYYIVPESPEIVYQALTNEKTLSLWTGFKASMPLEEGAMFSWFDDNISGINLHFEPNKRIEQMWFFGNQKEDSIVTFKLHPHKKGTSLELIHTNIPNKDYENIIEGWNNIFFENLIDFYSSE